MTVGDIAAQHGFTLVSQLSDYRQGWSEINRLGDWAGSTTEIGSADIRWNTNYSQWADRQPAGDTNLTVCRRTRFGVCHLVVNVAVPTSGGPGNGTTLFWLPDGYTPKVLTTFNGWLYNSQTGAGWGAGPCALQVAPDGKVLFVTGISGNVPGNGGGIFGSCSFGTVW